MYDVSVIVPIYNVEQYIDRCIDSIVNQTDDNIEIILVDDGSTDSSSLKCDEYKNKDKRIKVIHKKNAGLGFARNSGLEIANGEYVLFIDSDDYIEKDMIKELYGTAKVNSADACYSDYFRDYDDKIVKNERMKGCAGIYNRQEVLNKIIPWVVGGAPDDKYDEVLGWGVWKSLYKRDLIEKKGIKFHSEREYISEDIIFQLDFLTYASCVAVVEKPFYHYCLRNGSLSAKYQENRRIKNYELYLAQMERLNALNIDHEVLYRAQRQLIGASRINIMMAVDSLKFVDAFYAIKKYEDDDNLIDILNAYPMEKLPYKQRIFARLLEKKATILIYLITKMYVKKNYKSL